MAKTKKLKDRPPLAKNIVLLRKAKGWNQEDLAHAVGVSLTTVKNIERGKNECGPDVRGAIAEAFNVEVSDLFSVDGASAVIRLEGELTALTLQLAQAIREKQQLISELDKLRAEKGIGETFSEKLRRLKAHSTSSKLPRDTKNK